MLSLTWFLTLLAILMSSFALLASLRNVVESFVSINCKDASAGLAVDNVGKTLKNLNTLYDPYIEMNPSFFQALLSEFVQSSYASYAPTASSANSSRTSAGKMQTALKRGWTDFFKNSVIPRYGSTDPRYYMVNDRPDNSKYFLFSENVCEGNEKLRCIMYRPERNFAFVVIFSFQKGRFTDATVVSIIPEQDLYSLDLRPPSPSSSSSSPPSSLWSGDFSSSLDSSDDSSMMTEEKIQRALADRKDTTQIPRSDLNQVSHIDGRSIDDSYFAGYQCYDDNIKRKYECSMEADRFGSRKDVSSWDHICTRNEDCPYFRKNKNYPNTRGGCRDGFCELPVNMTQTSPRAVLSEPSKAFCYNCDAEDDAYKCCISQEQRKYRSYGLLASPDYAFLGDNIERKRYGSILRNRGLTP